VLLPLRATSPHVASSNDGVPAEQAAGRVEPETCRHWQAAVECRETCRCSCLVWQDAPEVFSGPSSMRGDDGWQLEEVFDEQEQHAYDDAAGF
jgi:hypothetical protein